MRCFFFISTLESLGHLGEGDPTKTNEKRWQIWIAEGDSRPLYPKQLNVMSETLSLFLEKWCKDWESISFKTASVTLVKTNLIKHWGIDRQLEHFLSHYGNLHQKIWTHLNFSYWGNYLNIWKNFANTLERKWNH